MMQERGISMEQAKFPFPYPPWDPIPWWILIVAVQIEGRVAALEREVTQLRKVHEIVVGK